MPKRNGKDRQNFGTTNSSDPIQGKRILREVRARDEWQSCLITQDGLTCGVVVRKVVEPASCLVRYLIVYHDAQDRHVLVPATTVIGGDMGEIYCTLDGSQVNRLPTYTFSEITQSLEQAIHEAVGHVPYWLDEEGPQGSVDD